MIKYSNLIKPFDIIIIGSSFLQAASAYQQKQRKENIKLPRFELTEKLSFELDEIRERVHLLPA